MISNACFHVPMPLQETKKLPESAWRNCLLYDQFLFQFANHNPKIDPHPRCMFVLRQFMEGVSEKIARLDWLGANASAADILKALKVQFMYDVIDGDNDLHNARSWHAVLGVSFSNDETGCTRSLPK